MRKFTILLFLLLGSFLFLHSQSVNRRGYNSLLSYKSFIRGIYYFNLKSYNAAIDNFLKSLERNPNDYRTRMWLGKSYYLAGYERNAISEWERVISQGGGTNLLRQKLNFIFFQKSINRKYKIENGYIPLKKIEGVQNREYCYIHPTSVGMRGAKELFIVGFSSGGIAIFNHNGKLINEINRGNGSLKKPYGMAFDSDGNLYVTDFGGDTVHIFNKKNKFITSFGGFGITNSKFAGPEGIFVDNNNNIFVVDSGNNRIQQFKRDNAFNVVFVRSFGKRGSRAGEFFRPSDIVVSKNKKIFVTDTGNKRIQVFDDSGNFINQFGNDFLKKPRGLTFVDKNNLIVADEKLGILKYNLLEATWHVIKKRDNSEIVTPVDVYVDHHNMMYVADYGRKNLLIMIPEKLKYVNLDVNIRQTFNNDYPVVTHRIYIKDRLSRDIAGLDVTNFKIFEFGKKIKTFNVKQFKPPLNRMKIVVVNDRSKRMKKYNSELKDLMAVFLRKLNSSDLIKVINFGNGMDDTIPFINERLRPLSAITQEQYSDRAISGKALYKGISKSFSNTHNSRILLVTNGKLDENSFAPYGLEGIMNYAKNNDIPVFVLCFGTGSRVQDLKILASKTGGKFISASNSNDIYRLAKLMRKNRSISYFLSYRTQSASRFASQAWRTLRIEVNYKKLFGLDEGGYYIP